MEKNHLSGTVRYYGCPGEEYGSAKAFMARDGLFDDVDACFTWHPGTTNNVWLCSSLANLSVFFRFKGRTSHAASTPFLGRSALDACELMSMGVNYLREHIIPEARVHYAYVDVGGIAPNVVQDHAAVHYFIRAPRVHQMMEIYERVCDVARGCLLYTSSQLIAFPHFIQNLLFLQLELAGLAFQPGLFPLHTQDLVVFLLGLPPILGALAFDTQLFLC